MVSNDLMRGKKVKMYLLGFLTILSLATMTAHINSNSPNQWTTVPIFVQAVQLRDQDLDVNEVELYADVIATQDDKKQSKGQKKQADAHKAKPCSQYNQNDQMQYIEYLQCQEDQRVIAAQKAAQKKEVEEQKKQRKDAANKKKDKKLSEEETSTLLQAGAEIEVDSTIGSLSGVQDESDQPVNKKEQEITKSEVGGEATPYEMASMAEEGFSSETPELPSNMTENSALMTDLSIQDQSAALAQMKEDHKEDMKKAAQMEIDKKKKEQEMKKSVKMQKKEQDEEDAKEQEFEKVADPDLSYFLNNDKNVDGLMDKLFK